MVNNSDDNKVRRRKVSSNNKNNYTNRVKRPSNSYDEKKLRENTKSKPIFEKVVNEDFKRENINKSSIYKNNNERLQPKNQRYSRQNEKIKEKEYDYSMLPSERKKLARENSKETLNKNNDKFNYAARENDRYHQKNRGTLKSKEAYTNRDREIVKKTKQKNKSKRKKKKDTKNKILSYFYRIVSVVLVLCVLVGACGIGYAKYITKDMPEVTEKMVHEKYISSKEVPITDMPKDLKNAIISIEDERFYKHNGVDGKALVRSVVHNILTDSRQGGSTIEMQLSKNLLTSSEVSIKRKIMDMYNAVGMNKVMKKDEILEAYLNNIYFGKNAYGVEAGSELYFGKNVKDLNLAESAMLVGITNNPKIYSNYSAAKTRQKIILKKMYELGYIKEAQYKEAIAEMVHFRSEID